MENLRNPEEGWRPNLEINKQATLVLGGGLMFYPLQISSLYPPSLVFDDRPDQWKEKK